MLNNLATNWLVSFIPGYSLIGTILACAILIFFSAWYSGTETGLYRMSRLRLHLACRKKNQSAMILDRLLGSPQYLISVFLVGNNIVNYLLTSTITTYFNTQNLSTGKIELYTTLILTPIVFIFGETVPKMCFYTRSNALMLRSAKFIHLNSLLFRFSGLGFIFDRFSKLAIQMANRLTPSDEISSHNWDDLGVLLRENFIAGPLSKIQGGLAEQLFKLPHIRVTRILTPLQKVFALPADISRQDFLEKLKNKPFSRIPLYDGDPKNIIGAVSIYEIFASSTDSSPKTFMQNIQRLKSDENVLSSLTKMQKSAIRLALIVDRNNNPIGIITINDLLEEIMTGLE